ncbi:MAG: hypothetical protein ACYSUG_02710, partial [Planctomycetota bacterium]
ADVRGRAGGPFSCNHGIVDFLNGPLYTGIRCRTRHHILNLVDGCNTGLGSQSQQPGSDNKTDQNN